MTPFVPGEFVLTIPIGLLLLIVFIVGFFVGVFISGLIMRQMGVRLSKQTTVEKAEKPKRKRGRPRKEKKEEEREKEKKNFSGGVIPG